VAPETRSRSLAKAVSYRILSSLITGGIVFGITQRGLLAIGIALVDSAVKTLTYYLHERAWMLVAFGRPHPPESSSAPGRAAATANMLSLPVGLSGWNSPSEVEVRIGL
jgi:uncharacterized membrane protein